MTNNHYQNEADCIKKCFRIDHKFNATEDSDETTTVSPGLIIGQNDAPTARTRRSPEDNPQHNKRSKRDLFVAAQTADNTNTILLDRRRHLRAKFGWNERVVVHVAFNHLQYVSIAQSPSMTFSTFVGNIGGQVITSILKVHCAV